jgi:hypothetical protein
LAFYRREGGFRPAALRSLLDRGVDLADAPVEVRYHVRLNRDPGFDIGSAAGDGSLAFDPVPDMRLGEEAERADHV